MQIAEKLERQRRRLGTRQVRQQLRQRRDLSQLGVYRQSRRARPAGRGRDAERPLQPGGRLLALRPLRRRLRRRDDRPDFLRKTGRKDYRGEFHRIMAEAHIKSRDYLEAVQEFDTAIRQDRDPRQAAAAFARVGDIYFDLNNYDLAEDAYALGEKLDEDRGEINPQQLALRGESLFWLGRFSERSGYCISRSAAPYRKSVVPMPPDYEAWAALRVADAYLARWAAVKDRQSEAAKTLRDQAALEYYKVGHEYRSAVAGRVAKVRQACLELPYYGGHNVAHARDLLEEAKADAKFPAPAREIAWACQVASYTEREQTPEMLQRVKAFAENYPESGFLRRSSRRCASSRLRTLTATLRRATYTGR